MTEISDMTAFASAVRATPEEFAAQLQAIGDLGDIQPLLDAVSEIVMILNAQRQIVTFSRSLSDLLGVRDCRSLLGLRPGEAVGCSHASERSSGCGTTEYCKLCGAVDAILSGLEGKPASRECRLLNSQGQAMDFMVRSTPLKLRGQRFIAVTLSDISHEKRRRALERVFFHDLMNTAGGLRMLSEHLLRKSPEQNKEAVSELLRGMNQLMEEIVSQRDLSAAENHELPVRPIRMSSREFLDNVVESCAYLREGLKCGLVIDERSEDVSFKSDCTILTRVLTNMVKNAMEASREGQTVTVGCRRDGRSLRLWVHNPSHIPREVQLQLFQRSFTTKGVGRGLGTYSMRLLAERYLKGSVSCESSEQSGTVFSACCPLMLE